MKKKIVLAFAIPILLPVLVVMIVINKVSSLIYKARTKGIECKPLYSSTVASKNGITRIIVCDNIKYNGIIYAALPFGCYHHKSNSILVNNAAYSSGHVEAIVAHEVGHRCDNSSYSNKLRKELAADAYGASIVGADRMVNMLRYLRKQYIKRGFINMSINRRIRRMRQLAKEG